MATGISSRVLVVRAVKLLDPLIRVMDRIRIFGLKVDRLLSARGSGRFICWRPFHGDRVRDDEEWMEWINWEN